MVSFIRTISTRRLLTLVAGVLAVAVGGTAIALAATGAGPVPPRKPLAAAVHDALAAPAVDGVTARIKFTNHLIDSADVGEGAGPAITGASGRLWASSDHRLRLELQSDRGDVQAVVDGRRWWVYDASSNTLYRGTLQRHRQKREKRETKGVPSLARIQRQLAQVMEHANLSGAVPGDIAGRPAYRVTIGPKRNGGLLGSLQLALDAEHGVPLRAAVYPRGSSSPVLELRATEVSFGKVPASAFAVTPPAHAKRVDVAPVRGHERGHRLSFSVTAPRKLAGLSRQEVRQTGSGALVTYGQGLGGIAVIERKAEGSADNRKFVTALGTAINFRRGGVDYTVLGSLPAAKVEAAARGL